MLLVFWLGYPALVTAEGQQSLMWFLAMFGAVFLVAFRPKLFLFVLAISAIVFLLNWVWRTLELSTRP